MKYLKFSLSSIIALNSSLMLALSAVISGLSDYYHDIESELIFIMIFALTFLCNDNLVRKKDVTWRCYFIFFLCSFYLFISPIYRLLTENVWTIDFVILSLISIIANGLFCMTYIRTLFYFKSSHKLSLYIVSAVLFLSVIIFAVFLQYYTIVIISTFTLLLVICAILENRMKGRKMHELC